MAETLAAIGLAGNIVQFVDFGIKVVSKGAHLYQSAEGALKENVELEHIVSDVKMLSQSLTSGAYSIALNRATSEDEKSLRNLADSCTQLTDELLAILKGIQMDGRKNRKLESIKKSLRSVWEKQRIRDLEDRLSRIKQQVCLHLIVLLR
jgi:hypothetical protein